MYKAKWDGFQYYTDDYSFKENIDRGTSEPSIQSLNAIDKYLRLFPNKNKVYVDVGSHIGTTMLPYSRRFSKVIGFEPNRVQFDLSQQNININNINNVTVYNYGLLNENCNVDIIPHEGGNSGCFYVKKSDNGSIICVTLDSQEIDRVDYIKIDTEGSELFVLFGGIHLITKWKPLIQFEKNGCSEKYFNIPSSIIEDLLKSLGYILFDNHDPNNPIYYCPSIENIIYMFWTDNNEMSPNRLTSYHNFIEKSQATVKLITPNILHEYILHPLHPAYTYLSATHKADYLRTYFMHFYGGGYSDIKATTGSWLSSFDNLRKSDKWIIGYKEVEGGAISELADKWEDLIGNCCYICKPNTILTSEWYSQMISLLDTKLEQLKQFPATYPQDCAENKNGYPIEWNEMLGRIFHKISYKYKHKLLNTLPILEFKNYR